MKFVATRSSFLAAVAVAASAVPARSPKPVLQCLKLTAGPDGLTVEGTDLELHVAPTTADVQVESPGQALLPADKLHDILRNVTDDNVTVSVENATATVATQDCKFKLHTGNVKDFPVPRLVEEAVEVELPMPTFQTLIGKTEFCTAKESTRYAFTAVHVAVDGAKVEFAATDGRRLAVARATLERKARKKVRALLPAKSLAATDKLRAEVRDPGPDGNGKGTKPLTVRLQFTENACRIVHPDATITTVLVEGTFPPYEDIIPKDSTRKVNVARPDLQGAVRRAALLAAAESKGIRCAISKAKGLVLSSRDPSAGEATINLPCKVDGADLEIGFNPDFLGDALRVLGHEDVALELTAPNRPGLLSAPGKDDFLYVLMPVNLA